MDNETAKAVGTLFLAIVNSLTDEHRAEIWAAVERAANNPRHSAENREFFKALHNAGTSDLGQLVLQNECADNGGRPRLRVIDGDDAA